MVINTHILTDIHPMYFIRQTPGAMPCWDDVNFTFGLQIPNNLDALIVYTQHRLGVKTNLPRARCAFVAGEPDCHGYYPDAFLNQFGLIVVSGQRRLKTIRLRENMAVPWHIGVDHAVPEQAITYDKILDWDIPMKDNSISIVTSNNSSLPYHRKRLRLIDYLHKHLPNHTLIRYGRGTQYIADKKDALLPHRYHIVLENNNEPWGWSEKLADSLLAYSFPFYVGCSNLEDQFPAESFLRLDLENYEGALKTIEVAVKNGLWSKRLPAIRKARELILKDYNIMAVFARVAKALIVQPVTDGTVKLYSKKSSVPTRGSGVRNYFEFICRRGILAIDPNWEMRHYIKSHHPDRA